MILSQQNGNIFQPRRPVVFGINAEGLNDAGFAGYVANTWWPRLENCGSHALGTILPFSYNNDEFNFYAIVCHTLKPGGWDLTAGHLYQALNELEAHGEMNMALPGNGPIGAAMGADVKAIMRAIDTSKAKVHLFSKEPFPE